MARGHNGIVSALSGQAVTVESGEVGGTDAQDIADVAIRVNRQVQARVNDRGRWHPGGHAGGKSEGLGDNLRSRQPALRRPLR